MSIFSYDKKHVKILLRVLFVAALCLGVGTATHYYSSSVPKDTYSEAKEALAEGNYLEADKLLKDIEEYADSMDIRKQISDELIVFKCIDAIKKYDDKSIILQVYDAEIYNEDVKKVILSYGVPGNDGDTIIYRALFTEQDGEYIMHNAPITSFESGNIKNDNDKDTLNEIIRLRSERTDLSVANIDRVNEIVDLGIDVDFK